MSAYCCVKLDLCINNPEYFLPNTKAGFATNKIFQFGTVPFPVRKAETLPLHLTYLQLQYSFFSVSLVTQSTRLAVIIVAILTFTGMLWRTLQTRTAFSVTYTGATRSRFNL